MLTYSIHPIIQAAMILAMVYVWWLGSRRFLMLHLERKTKFNWRRHVRVGVVVLVVASAGLVAGLYMGKDLWYRYLASGLHGYFALVSIPLILFGLISGLYMNARKRPRRILPLIHAVNNTVLLGLFMALAVTGIGLYLELIGEMGKL